ncbi:MAG: hypothetical protein ABFC94_02965 [Syntrophomonas sp.]
MNTVYYFLQSLPESMGLIALSLAIAQVPLRWGRILIGGIIISVISYIIRTLPVTFGFHIPVMIFVLFLLIVKFTNVTPSRTVIAVFSSFFALAMLEYLVSSIFFACSHLDAQQSFANKGLWAALGITQDFILIVLALVIPRFLKPSEVAWEK